MNPESSHQCCLRDILSQFLVHWINHFTTCAINEQGQYSCTALLIFNGRKTIYHCNYCLLYVTH